MYLLQELLFHSKKQGRRVAAASAHPSTTKSRLAQHSSTGVCRTWHTVDA